MSETNNSTFTYSEVPIIRPLMVLVECLFNSEQVSLMRLIYFESTETSGLNSEGGLSFGWSLYSGT